MSIKDLFGKTSPSLEETVQDVESVAFVEEKTKADQTYHPQIDFSDPENFAYYGSAELYYDAAIRRIYEDYPYDGSKSEQIEFEEKASALERWVFENKYPKTTGHVQLGTTLDITGALSPSNFSTTSTPEYIKVWGGLHTDSSATTLSDHFESSARYDADKNRNQNWNCDLDEGITIEFWFKKDSYNPTTEPFEVILDLWNGEAVGSSDECRLVITTAEIASVPTMLFTLKSNGVSQTGQFVITNSSSWNHYSISFKNNSTTTQVLTYSNGEELAPVASMGSLFSSFTGRINGFIGALQDEFQAGNGSVGGGKLSAQLDEFRFWKTKRTSRQIKLNWFNGIGGGANTDDATSDLGVYLKFNEGIVGTNAADSVVLDYSGRLANGVWVGYENTNLARSTDSAMETVGYTETPSPIIYKEHSSVSTLISEMQTSGSVYDADRGQSFFRSMPTWLQEEDNGNFRLFSQILASYMDTLHVQIKELTELKTKRYPMEGVKASTMAADLLKDKGFMISNMFESNEVYEKLASINLQDTQFETELHEIKNIIYTNIYNNLEKIYKTKGTEGSIRNLIRCYGIDDELIKLNLYTDGGTQYFTDKSRETSVKKKYINFNDPTRFEASIHQFASSTNPNSFISSAVDASRNAFTMEADIVVPYKKEVDEKGYFATPFLSASVMGFHEAAAISTDFTWQLNGNDLQVYLVRDSLNSRHAKFVMQNLAGTINEESDYIYDIYENEHYNVALRIKPQTYPYAGGVTNTTPDYDIELYAVTTNFGEIENEVLLSTTILNAPGLALMNASKRVYAGAHVENFTGSVEQETDLKIGGVRAWLDYLANDEILQHNKDVLNYGMRSSIDGSNLYLIDDVQVPSQDLTIFNWDFDTVITTGTSSVFIVEDITSGSTDRIYGWVDDVIRREHKAKSSGFTIPNDSSIIDYEFIQAYKKQLPESAYDAQSIYIKGDQEINFSDDDDVSDNLFIMEKSPASLISEEMLKSFSTTLEFANLFMRPIERFRVEYKDLARARQLFFERVESDMDFDKFFEYFKWIDSSISSMVNQLVPMSANFAGGIVDVIEPHILERDKYQRQVGLLSTVTSTEASIRGAQELKYNWRVGHAPLSGDENENCLWQKERKEHPIDRPEEEAIRQVLVTQNALTASNPINLSGSNGVYAGNTYATRRLSRPYTLDIGFSNSIHGGINYSINKDRDMIGPQIAVGNASNAGTPENVVIIGAGDGTGTNPKPACIDEHKPEELRKFKYDGFAVLGKHATLATQEPKSDEDQYAYRQKISKIIPGNIVSSSVNTGYSSLINKQASAGGFGEGFDLVNLHSDTTDITNEISIQGPFTHTHIGGRQSRHIHYMEGFDQTLGKIPNIADRPEAWNIYIAELDATDTEVGSGVGDGAIGFTTPDYSVGPLDTDQQKATLYREERAKRPVNIKNIQTIIGTGSHGNFTYGYEVMSTFGDQGYFLRRSDNLLPDAISQELPETTNYQTLIAQTSSVSGNYFGADNNRQYDSREVIAGQTSTQATGGGFRILGIDRISTGHYVTIDSVIYEIGSAIQGGETIALESTNSAFYAGLSSLLSISFPPSSFVVNYTPITTPVSAETPAQSALGGDFAVLGFARVVQGDYININGVNYEIGSAIQGGETISIESTNTAFYNGIRTLLMTHFSPSNFAIGYYETETEDSPETPGVESSGGSFRVLGFADVSPGHYITIDSTDYEIDTNVRGGMTLPIVTTSNNDFYGSLQTLLETNFPTSDYTVSYTAADNGGTLPGSAGQALTITGADADIGLEFVGKPSWSPTAPGATSQPFTMSFYINAPNTTWTGSSNGQMTIYSEFWTTGAQQVNSPSKLLSLAYSASNGWTLQFTMGYRRDGGALTTFRHDFHDFLGQYGGQLTHVLITTEGTMDPITYDSNGNIVTINTQTKLYINGVFKDWNSYTDQNYNGGADENYFTPADPINSPHLSPEIYKFYIGTLKTTLSATQGLSQAGETTILDEFMIFDAYFGGNQALIDEIYNNGYQLDYDNLSSLTTYANAKAFYTFSETNDSFVNGGTVHNKVANSENLTVYDNSNDRISTSFSGPATAGTIVYHADFTIVPNAVGTYGDFDVSIPVVAHTSFQNPVASTGGVDFIAAVIHSQANFGINPYNNPGTAGNFNVTVGAGSSFFDTQDSTGGVDFVAAVNNSHADFTITPNNDGSYGNFNVDILPVSNPSFSDSQHSINGLDYIAPTLLGSTNMVDTQDRSTGSANVIRTRFSAPGGPEVNSSGYLDVVTQQYSVHNSINFRNLTTRASGSGESDTIRLDTHQVSVAEGRREGLRTLRARHQGKFGTESQYGAVSATDYNSNASFHKQHRNGQNVLTIVDENSIGVRFANTTSEFAVITNLSPEGEVDNQQGGLSFSFWLKLDPDSAGVQKNGILDSDNLKIWRVRSASNSDKIHLRFKCNNVSPWIGVDFDVQPFTLQRWSHFIISCDLLNLENCRMTLSGVEATLLFATPESFVNNFPIFPFEGTVSLARATPAPVLTLISLHGSIMNFSYFDSFILNDTQAVQILEEHQNGSEISQISSLVGFWFLGQETGLETNTVIPNRAAGAIIIQASFGKANDSFELLNPNSSIDVSTVDGYYIWSYVEKHGPQRTDNDNFSSLLPASDFQYSWINSAISGANAPDQYILGHAPKNGMIRTEIGYHEAIRFPTISDMELDDCSATPTADPLVTWGNTGQFTDDEDFILSMDESATTSQTILNFGEISTLQFTFNNLGPCGFNGAQVSLVESGQPRSFGSSVSLPALYFNPSNSAIFDYATNRSGHIEEQEITLVNVSTDEPVLESQLWQQRTFNGQPIIQLQQQNSHTSLVPFSQIGLANSNEKTIADANQSYHSFSSQNIQCIGVDQQIEVYFKDGGLAPVIVSQGSDSTAPPWYNIPTLYYSVGDRVIVHSTVYSCNNYFEDTISNTFLRATTIAPTLVSDVTFYDDDGSGGRTLTTAESKTTTVVPGSSTPGVNEVSEAEANLTTLGYVASFHLLDNVGGLEFELSTESTSAPDQTSGFQSTVPSSFSQIYYSSNPFDQVTLTLTSRSTSGLSVEDVSTIIFNNATLDNTTLVSNATYPNYSAIAGARTTRTVTADTTIAIVADGTPIGQTQNKITETEANVNLSFSSVGTNMPCGASATYQIYISENGATETLHGPNPNNRPNVEYSAGDTIAYRVTVSQCTDALGNPYTDEITITLQDAAPVSGP